MKTPLLFCLIILRCCAMAIADDPVFDIPRLDGITIDGNNNDWGENGFRVETLASDSGEVRDPRDFDARFRLGWDERGLLVLVTVHEKNITEADQPRDLAQKDSVELYMATAPGAPQAFQLLAGTGADPKFPSLRTSIKDLREPAPARKLEAETAATQTKDGYLLESRLPWSNLAITPGPGQEAAFELSVNDLDQNGSRLTVTWCPNYRSVAHRKAMFRVRLASQAAPAVHIAARAIVDQGRPRAEIIGPADLAGQEVTAAANGAVFSTSKFEPDSGRARAALFLPPSTALISCADGESIAIDANDAHVLTDKAIAAAHVVFRSCVFNGEKFPQCDFEPSDAARSLGRCVLTPTFYDADYHEVTTAARPGRYGAIVQVSTPSGQTFKRFVTLYRTPEDVTWRLAKLHLGPVVFPPELGVGAAAVSERTSDIDDFFRDQIRGGFDRSEDAAYLFASLNEWKPGGEPARDRNGSYASAQKWWYGLKKQTGNLRTDYFVHLPAAYDGDPAKKWPLILFLHGSGERGYDISSVANTGLPHNLATQPGFPFIVIAPQCSPGEWWSPAELNDLLDRVQAKYRVDTSRVYLTGLSMGGYGSWALAIESPNRFAAVVPICGRGDPEDAARIKDIPVWVFHGGKDQTVPIQFSQAMADALKNAGGHVKFTIFPEADHDSWTQAYAMPELYDWLLQQHRQ